MIATFVINLDRSTARLERITKQFALAGLRFNRFPAIDGCNIPQEFQTYFQGCNLLPGEIGCYASHLALWHLVAERDQPALICEDDVLLPDDLGALLDDLLAALPNGWDVVRLSSVAKRGIVPIDGRLTGSRSLVQYSREPTNAGATLVSPGGARKLIEPRAIRRPVDQDLRCPWDFGLRTYGVVPRPIREVPGGDSIIGAIGHRIHRTSEMTNLAVRIAHNVRSLGFSNWARCLAWNAMGRKLVPSGAEWSFVPNADRPLSRLGPAPATIERPV
jgi:glycosyl transferase, family 25